MTVERGASAMVSMVRQETDGEVVYLYAPDSERGNTNFAFRAVRFKNPTNSTLETGPVTVYGEEKFIGEGLTEPIAPKSSAVVPYALDRQIVVERNTGEENKLSRLVTLQRGILTAEVQHIRRQKMTITNRLPELAKVYIRHTVNKGWKLLEAPPAYERVGYAHLFEVHLRARARAGRHGLGGQQLGQQDVLGQQHRPLEDVAQLADVAGPLARGERVECRWRERSAGAGCSRA